MPSRWFGFLLSCALAVFPLAPPAHVHDTTDESGHHLVAHSHVDAHHHHVAVPQRGALEIEDEDSVVTTLDPVFIASAPHNVAAPAPPVVALLPEPSAPVAIRRAPFVERLNHGPPRAPAPLRGPPSKTRT